MTRRPTLQQPPGDGWLSRAACRDSDARLFTEPQGPDDVRKAMATCNTCSVRAACLAAALHHSAEEDVGIWGGTTEPTRREIRTGRLTTEQALNHDGQRCPEPEKGRVNGSVRGKPTGSKVVSARLAPKLPVPRPPSLSTSMATTSPLTGARSSSASTATGRGRLRSTIASSPPPAPPPKRRLASATLHNNREAVLPEPGGQTGGRACPVTSTAMNGAQPCVQHTLVTIRPAGEQLPSRHAPGASAEEERRS